MFGKPGIPHVSGAVTRGSRLEGRYLFSDGLRVDGEFVGELYGQGDSGTLVVGQDGVVQGPVRAAHVVIQGKVVGPILATERLELHAGAQVDGELHYRMLEMHPGAVVTGQLVPLLGHREPAMPSAEPEVSAGQAGAGAQHEPALEDTPITTGDEDPELRQRKPE